MRAAPAASTLTAESGSACCVASVRFMQAPCPERHYCSLCHLRGGDARRGAFPDWTQPPGATPRLQKFRWRPTIEPPGIRSSASQSVSFHTRSSHNRHAGARLPPWQSRTRLTTDDWPPGGFPMSRCTRRRGPDRQPQKPGQPLLDRLRTAPVGCGWLVDARLSPDHAARQSPASRSSGSRHAADGHRHMVSIEA